MTVLLREAIGDRLRHARTNQRRTLREVSRAARVSLGYLSEVERGRKEASSELLAAICDALDLPLSELLHRVASDITAVEPVTSSAPLSPEQIEQPAASAEQLPSGTTASATIEGGRLMPAVLGNELADFRLQPVLSHQLGSSLDRPRGEVVAA